MAILDTNISALEIPPFRGWYTPPLNFKLYRGDGLFDFTYTIDYLKKFQQNTTLEYWVNRFTGSDSNAGTKAAPFKSIEKSLITGTGSKKVFVEAGEYDYDTGWLANNSPAGTSDTIMIAVNGRVKCTTLKKGLSWVNTTGSEYKITKTESDAWAIVTETGQDSDDYGINGYLPYELDGIGSIESPANRAQVDHFVYTAGSAAGSLNEGEYFISGNDLHVRAIGSGSPSSSVRPYLGGDCAKHLYGNLYVSGFDFEGGRTSFNHQGESTEQEVIFVDCTFKYCGNNTLNNYNLQSGNGKTIMIRCAGAYSWRDTFNYHVASGKNLLVIELDCKARRAGLGGQTNNNGSTIHENGVIVRVNGFYQVASGPTVNDIDTTKVMMYGCEVGGCLITSGTSGFNLGCTGTGSQTLLDTCKVTNEADTSAYGINLASTGTLYHKNTDIYAGTNILNGTVVAVA